ncbi:MAG: CDP-diacylglycerol--glycerol-3-phosphate 3-phosphatidyltransferase [Planctomycetaceae bacterium]|nr:CDP-diacylglycerol--glycerol-3-phosphate 3-phosphatidyltransferase [Planctomycetaceae bacterium]
MSALEQTSPAEAGRSSGKRPPLPIDRRSLNVPNILTLSRFVLSLVLFVLIDYDGWWRLSAALFIVAASTDFLDGYYARKYGQVTVLGRVLDPFVDKIIICGSFIFLLRYPQSGVTTWMVFVIIGREMFVTSLRAILERHGTDFSAKWSGKIKMILQCVAVPVSLFSLSPEFREDISPIISPAAFDTFRDAFLWATVLFTLYSGVEYTVRGFRLLNQSIREKQIDEQIRPS